MAVNTLSIISIWQDGQKPETHTLLVLEDASYTVAMPFDEVCIEIEAAQMDDLQEEE